MSALARVVDAVVVAVDAADVLDEPETVRIGEIVAIAEPGRAGSVLVVKALFWAIMVSLSEGFELLPIVLFEKPSPGLTAGSVLAGAFGLCGSF